MPRWNQSGPMIIGLASLRQRFQPVCLGATDNDASSRLSRFMPAFSIHSCFAPQMPGAGNARLRKRLCFLELLDCGVRRAGTDEIDALTEFRSGAAQEFTIIPPFRWRTSLFPVMGSLFAIFFCIGLFGRPWSYAVQRGMEGPL